MNIHAIPAAHRELTELQKHAIIGFLERYPGSRVRITKKRIMSYRWGWWEAIPRNEYEFWAARRNIRTRWRDNLVEWRDL